MFLGKLYPLWVAVAGENGQAQPPHQLNYHQNQAPPFISSNTISVAQRQLSTYHNLQQATSLQPWKPLKRRISTGQAVIQQLWESLRKSQEENRIIQQELETQLLYYQSRESEYEEKIDVLEKNFQFDHNNGNFCNSAGSRKHHF